MIRVEQGGEYRGERYVSCDAHEDEPQPEGRTVERPIAMFEGESLAGLLAFIGEHLECP